MIQSPRITTLLRLEDDNHVKSTARLSHQWLDRASHYLCSLFKLDTFGNLNVLF